MKDNYDDCFLDTEEIADPLYGMVDISAFEKRLINCREFQRIKHIRQLGFARMVYPAAEHTRFAHSIGVCYQAKRLIKKINANLLREKRYREWRENGAYCELTGSEFKKIDEVERVVMAVAALLHDLSHAPFSHDIESPSNYDSENGIPSHDDFCNNPAFYLYLFDTQFSQVANIIKIYNRIFWKDGICNPMRGGEWGTIINQEWEDSLTEDGYIKVGNKTDDKKLIEQNGNHPAIKKLPILGVMIFEIHLFGKEKDWLSIKKDLGGRKIVDAQDTDKSIKVKVGWENRPENYVLWRPMRGWFRPYRQEIIENTICADLIDYIQRDGHYSGIISHMDLKFLDRMTITRAILGDGEPIDLLFPWSKIPATCEHVVFDIYDHKRGFIRQSVITEILASLHARYLLCERVYQHRVVEAARTMLQKISSLLCDAGVLSVEFIHKNKSNHKTVGLIGDDIFLKWVCDLDEEKYPEKKDNICAAKELAGLLFDRRVYRETVIIDGIHGFEPPGTIAGGCKNCEALGDSLLPSDKGERNILEQEIADICKSLKQEWQSWGEDPNIIPKLPILIGLREFGKRYKVPLVLVVKPHRYPEVGAPLEIQPLFVCQNPSHIRKQLEAMESAYDSLWRVYLFVHPIFHKKGRPTRKSKSKKSPERRANEHVQWKFLELLRNRTKIGWRNSVNLSQLLPEESIDIPSFIQDENINEILEGKIVEQILQIASKRYIKQPEDQKKMVAFVASCREPFGDLLRDDSSLLSLFSNGGGNGQLINKFENVWQQEQIPPNEQKPTESPDFYEKAAKRIYSMLKKARGRLI